MILTFLDKKLRVIYSPLIEFDHPPYNASTMSIDKLRKYGIGFGAMCKKHLSPVILLLFLKVLTFQFLMILKGFITFNKLEIKRRRAAFTGRIKGFFLYGR
jgi:hypothetical protein